MTGERRFYVTSPIYYVNDSPHIGHAYTTLACDVMARFKRLDGYEVHFTTGTDEHGQKVEKSAQAAGVDPQAFTDRVSGNFRALAERMKFSNDDFLRTTEPRHTASAQALWKALVDRGEIYIGHYEGWYSVRDEAFWGEDELVKGTDGEKLAPTGAPVEWVKEPSYFFRLSAWRERLLAFYEANPDFIAPSSRRNEVISFVKGGLQDLSVSRTSFSWGVPVPGDAAHIMYVWIEALSVYLTGANYPNDGFEKWWPADLHLVGKDIVRFHAVYWPAFLMGAGLAPPHRVYAHGWWTNEGQKISKSLGNVIDPFQLVEEYGLDPVRHFLLREVPFGNDGDFSRTAMIGRYNSELANGLGNLAQRTLTLIQRNCGGMAPPPGNPPAGSAELLTAAQALPDLCRRLIDEQQFHVLLEEVWKVIRAADGYVDRSAPWALAKTDIEAMNAVLHTLLRTLIPIALMLQPFMPDSMAALLDLLGVPTDRRSFADADAGTIVPSGTPLPPPRAIFPRRVEPKPGAA